MEKDVSAIGGLFLTIMSDLRVRLWIEILPRFLLFYGPVSSLKVVHLSFETMTFTRLWNKGHTVQLEWAPPRTVSQL